MGLLIENIGTLVGLAEPGVDRREGAAMKELPCLEGAWLLVEEGRIADFGTGVAPVADERADGDPQTRSLGAFKDAKGWEYKEFWQKARD